MIETAKHHFIAGMDGTDKNHPIREWDRGVTQSQRTLNMLRPCIINPKLSADAFLEGQQDYNDVPFPHWDGECLYLKAPKKGHHGASMGWRASVSAPQKKLQMLHRVGPRNRSRKDIRYIGILPTAKIHI